MNLLDSRVGRRVLFTAYYFIEGAPIGFLWWCLPALMRARGVEPVAIGVLLGWLTLPWALKWIWAPLIDALQGPRWTLRSWIGAAQVGMLATLLPLWFSEDFLGSAWLAPCLIAHAICASTQDAAIDAVMARSAPAEERGRLSGWMQLGMLTARGLLGGGALLVQQRWGSANVIASLLGVVALGLLLLPHYRAPLAELPSVSVAGDRSPRRSFARFGRALLDALWRRRTLYGLGFAALGGAGFEAVGGFAGPLLTERASGDTQLAGSFFLLPAVLCSAIGGLLGGSWTDRVGEPRGALHAGVALCATLLLAALAIEWQPRASEGLFPWLAAVYVGIGWFTAASYALFLRWTDPRFGATQFSAFMGATNLCEVWAVAAAGWAISAVGYGWAFGGLALIGLLGLGLASLADGGEGRIANAGGSDSGMR